MYPTVFLLIIFYIFYIFYIFFYIIFYSQVEGKYLLMVLPLGMLDVPIVGQVQRKQFDSGGTPVDTPLKFILK
jgi:hypothetical protein